MENRGFSTGLSGRDKPILPLNIPVGTSAGMWVNFFLCFRLTEPALSRAGPKEGSEWPFSLLPGCGVRNPGPLGLASCLLPWHLLLSITADLEN